MSRCLPFDYVVGSAWRVQAVAIENSQWQARETADVDALRTQKRAALAESESQLKR